MTKKKNRYRKKNLKMKNLSEYKFRASSVGKLMTGVKPNLTEKQTETLQGLLEKRDNGKITDKQTQTLGSLIEKRDAKPKLSAGAKSYLDEIIQEVVFGRSKEITSKYLDKGISVEETSFTLYQKVSGQFLHKNKERFNNDWMTGEPDNTQGKIRDIKSSWDFSTFPLNDKEIPNPIYKWQLNSYMELTGRRESELVYCLVDTPFNLIDDEIRRLSWDMGYASVDSIPKEVIVETVSNHIYTEEGLKKFCHQDTNINLEWFEGNFNPIIEAHRVKVFDLDYNYSDIKLMYKYLKLAREYLVDAQLNLAKGIAA